MKTLLLGLLLLNSISALFAENQEIKVYFSPHGGCTEAVVDSIKQAKKSVLVEAYSFTSKPIAEALVEAEKRGVDVEVILDKSQETAKGSDAELIAENGIPTFIDAAYRIAHDKVMILDGKKVITGSFNFTKSAEDYNAENMLVISNNPKLALSYTEVWKRNLAQSHPYHQRTKSKHG